VESNDLVLIMFDIDTVVIGNLAVADGEAH
jgi:hypothetical protein